MDYIDEIEVNLGRNLRPIQPNLEFVRRLQNNLVQRKQIQLESVHFEFALITTCLGIFLGALIIWALRRIT
jgi:hypothetical protein